MTILLIFCALLLLLLLVTLFTPLILQIDSQRDVYQLRWGRLIRAELLFSEAEAMLRIRAFFFRKSWKIEDLILGALRFKDQNKEKKAQKEKPKKGRRKRRKKSRFGFRRIVRILRTFRVDYCKIEWDADDYVRNAWLFPVFYYLSNDKQRQLRINFLGRRSLALRLHNRIWNVIWAMR